MLLRKLRNWFLAGLVVLLPVWLTIFTVVWLFGTIDQAVVGPLEVYVHVPLPGVGIVLGTLLVLLVGWMTTQFAGRQLIAWGDEIFMKIPGVRAMYSAVKQVTETLLGPKEQAFTKVVLVEFPLSGHYSLGFVAGELPDSDLVRVWVPNGPSITAGPVLLVPSHRVAYLPMSVENGIKYMVSAGVLTPKPEDIAALNEAAKRLEEAACGRNDGPRVD